MKKRLLSIMAIAAMLMLGSVSMAMANYLWIEVIPSGPVVPTGTGVAVDVDFWFHSVDDNGAPLPLEIKLMAFNVGFDDLAFIPDTGEVEKNGTEPTDFWTWNTTGISPLIPNVLGQVQYRQGDALKHNGSVYWNMNAMTFGAGLVTSDVLMGTAHFITTTDVADLIVSGEDVWLEYVGAGFNIDLDQDGIVQQDECDILIVPTSGPDYAAEETGFYLDLNKFPWRPSDDPLTKYSGPAVAEMWLTYLWWDNTVNPSGPPDLGQYAPPLDDYTDQVWLYDYGHGENQTVNSGLELLDARGLRHTVQYLDPPWNPYHYNFSYYIKDNVDDALNDICHWVAYPAGGGIANPNGHGVDGYPVHVPAAVPTGGNYENWMAVRGIHTSTDPWSTSGYDIYGFWINDPNPVPYPYPGSLGANSFKSADQFKNEYFIQLTGLLEGDQCKDKWVSILEPPEYEAEIRIAEPVERFEDPIEPVTVEESVDLSDISISGFRAKRLATTDEVSVIREELEEEDALKVVQAAIDGVTDELIPYDPRFASVFADTVAGQPLLVNDDNGDYYLVPFNLTMKKIESVKKLHMARKEEPKPIPIEPIDLNEKNTLVVVLVNVEDGSFNRSH